MNQLLIVVSLSELIFILTGFYRAKNWFMLRVRLLKYDYTRELASEPRERNVSENTPRSRANLASQVLSKYPPASIARYTLNMNQCF